MEMSLRRARELVVLMVKEFQPYGATWSELHKKSGLKPTAYKRAFNFATDRKWFVGGGKRGELYCLNPDGSWRAALGPAYAGGADRINNATASSLQPAIGSNGPNADPIQALDPNSRIVALASEAIRHANKG
jgi:hypothetical protein